MKWLKDFFIRQKLTNFKKKQRKKTLVNYENIKNIMILSANEEEAIEAQKTIKSFWDKPVNINFIYQEKNPAIECYDYVDFNLLGKPKEKIKNIIAKPIDIILVTNDPMDTLTTHLIKSMPPVYCVGFYDSRHKNTLDLMLAKEDISLEQNLINLIKYLKKIN